MRHDPLGAPLHDGGGLSAARARTCAWSAFGCLPRAALAWPCCPGRGCVACGLLAQAPWAQALSRGGAVRRGPVRDFAAFVAARPAQAGNCAP